MRNNIVLLFVIFALALLLRIILLQTFPRGFDPDEASFGYIGYSLLKTGRDEWGALLPTTLRAYGDFRMPLYSYLATIPIAVFGLSEFSVRLVSVIIGSLAIFPTWLLAKKLFKSETIGILAALFLAISPWHIAISRVAHEASLTTFLFPLGLYLFIVGLEKPRFLIFSSLIFGLNIYSGNAARFFTVLFLICLLILKRKELFKLKQQFYYPAFIFIIFLIPIFTSFVSGGTARVSDVGVFNPTDGWKGVSEKRYEVVQAGLPDQVSRFFNNKVTFTLGEFSKNYLGYLSPEFLFRNGPGEANYGMQPGRGVLYIFEIMLLPLSIYLLIKKPTSATFVLLTWLLLAPIPAAFSKGSLNGLRAATLLPLFPILSSFGLISVLEFLKKKQLFTQGVTVSVIIIFISLSSFLENYYFRQPKENAKAMAYGWKEASQIVQENYARFNKIVISRSLSEPQMMIAFFTKYDPKEYQKNRDQFLGYERKRLTFLDQLGFYGFDKYEFRDIEWNRDKKIPDILMIGKLEEFPENVSGIHQVTLPEGKVSFKIVQSEISTNE